MRQTHSFIIWQSGFKYLSKILWEISQKFEIKYCQKIVWNKEEVAKKLGKFYPHREFNELSPKVKEIGGNELFFLLVVDKNAQIKNGVNLNILDYKELHRLKGARETKNYLHTSDLEKDAILDYFALFGKGKKEFKKLANMETIRCITNNDLGNLEIGQIPDIEFKTLRDVFNLLNKHIKYTVLRNWEDFDYGDIDILTQDYYNTLALLRAKPVCKQDYRVNHWVKVGNRILPFDIRYVGDNYYDKKWEELLLENRVFKDYFYRLSNEDYFWTLFYHTLFQKNKISQEYRKRLNFLGNDIPRFSPEILEKNKSAARFLKVYLKKNNLKTVRPKDKSVVIRATVLDKINLYCYCLKQIMKSIFKDRVDLPYLRERSSLEPFRSQLKKIKKIKNNVFFGPNLIIKRADENHKFLLKNELNFLTKLDKYKCFPKVIDYFEKDQQAFLALKRIKGINLYKKFKIPKRKQKVFIQGLDRIVEILKDERIVHRDIRPHNLIIDFKGRPFLLDFQFAIFDNQEIKTENSVEKYILEKCKINVGGRWRAKNVFLNRIDYLAADLIKKEYCQPPFNFLRFCKNYLLFLINNRRNR